MHMNLNNDQQDKRSLRGLNLGVRGSGSLKCDSPHKLIEVALLAGWSRYALFEEVHRCCGGGFQVS